MIYQGANPLVPYDVYIQALAAGYTGSETEFYQKLANYELPDDKEIGDVLKVNAQGEIEWGELVALPKGGSAGQYLRKSGSADGEASWQNLDTSGTWSGNAATATNADKIDGKHLSEIAATKSTTLSWNTESTIATIGGNNISVKLPANPNTNTTYTLTQDSTDGHKITLTPSSGTATTITIPDNNTTYSFTNKAATLAWNTTSTIATVGGTDITVKMPANPNTNTTYTLSQDANDGHKITLTPSSGTATTITIPDNNTTYSAATTSANGLMSAADKSKLDGIAAGANKYTLPTATSSTLGGIKVGTGLNISSGVLSVASAPKVDHGLSITVSGISQGTYNGSADVSIDVNASSLGLSSGLHFRGFVAAAPTGTTYTLIGGSATAAKNGDVVIIQSTGVEYLYNAGTWTQIGDSTSYAIKDHAHGNIDTNGHILNTNAAAVNNAILRSDGTGKIIAGPVIGTGTSKYLREDGTWVQPPNTTYSDVTTSAHGLMTAADKSKLDGITASADAVSFSRSLTSGTKIGTITINGTATDLYCQTNTDTNTKVTQTAVTASDYTNYRSLVWSSCNSGTAGFTPSTTTDVTYVSNNLYVQPSSGTIFATKFKGNLEGNVTGNVSGSSGSCTGNAATASKLATARTISLTGSVTGSGSFDGSGNLSISTTTNHSHSYLPLSGGAMTGTATWGGNVVALNFRTGNTSYDACITYNTAGNEALLFTTKNAVTGMMFVNGEDIITNNTSSRFQSLTPGLLIRNNSVVVGKAYATSNPTYKFEVNGTSYFNNTITLGSSGGYNISADGSTYTGNAATATNADKIDGKHLSEIAAAKSTTLSWNTNTTIATIGGNNINIKLPANPNTNTAHTTFAWTGGTSAGPTGSLSGNHTAVSFPAIPSASSSASGVITTGAQTLAGEKTFANKSTFNGSIVLGSGNYGSALPASAVAGQIFFQTIPANTYDVPAGGTDGQVLIKDGTVDYACSWGTVQALPSGGTAGQILTKASSTEGDASWQTMQALPAGGTANQVLVKVNGTDGNAQWVTTVASATSATNATNATNIYSSASTTKAYILGTTTASSANHATVYNASVYTSGSVLYGAAWNDYAEYRKSEEVQPGFVIREDKTGTMRIATERLMPGCEIVSDTFGFAIGETEDSTTPIAVTGRVLAYPYESIEEYELGDAVCSAPGGKVSKMTREEIREYPERILGTVSEIPDYEVWGSGNVCVNGRIWIRVR